MYLGSTLYTVVCFKKLELNSLLNNNNKNSLRVHPYNILSMFFLNFGWDKSMSIVILALLWLTEVVEEKNGLYLLLRC